MNAIPQHILNTAPAHHFTPVVTYSERICHYCGQSHGSHHYACPSAFDARMEELAKRLDMEYEYITFDEEVMA
jgi:hypothetical protein